MSLQKSQNVIVPGDLDTGVVTEYNGSDPASVVVYLDYLEYNKFFSPEDVHSIGWFERKRRKNTENFVIIWRGYVNMFGKRRIRVHYLPKLKDGSFGKRVTVIDRCNGVSKIK